MIDAQLQADLNKVIAAVQKIGPVLYRDAKKELKAAARPLSAAVKSVTPVGKKKEHKRYPKLRPGQKKAAKDQGRVIATYKSGNLKRSIGVISFRRAKTSVFVGARLRGVYDGYYGHTVNYPTRSVNDKMRPGKYFLEKAVATAGPATLKEAANKLSRVIVKYWESK
jgi:hypothetical protein